MPWTVTYLMSKTGRRSPPGDPGFTPPPILGEAWVGDLPAMHAAAPSNEQQMEALELHVLERAKTLHKRGLFDGGQWLVDVQKLVQTVEAETPRLLVDVHLARPGFLPPHEEHYRALFDNAMLGVIGPWKVLTVDTHVEASAYKPSQAAGWPDGRIRIRSAAHVVLHIEAPPIGWKGLTAQ